MWCAPALLPPFCTHLSVTLREQAGRLLASVWARVVGSVGAFERFGEALAAHDREQLLQVIVETSVEAMSENCSTPFWLSLAEIMSLPPAEE